MMIVLTSCGCSTPQDVSPFTRIAEIVVSLEPIVSDTVEFSSESGELSVETSETYDSESWLSRFADSVLYRDTPYMPREYDFSISYKEDLFVVGYGQQNVNVYKARYDDIPERWPDDAPWVIFFSPNVIEWCQGYHGPLKKDEVINNSYNVRTEILSEVEGADYSTEMLEIDIDTQVLCGVYDTCEVPWKDDTVQYIPLSIQYLDNMPTRRDYKFVPVLD
ncbi:MAG: hypothetical protein J5636_06460 [Clostridiales bacterium]|nr:hypothetical protein [Clostridiales bacterium]